MEALIRIFYENLRLFGLKAVLLGSHFYEKTRELKVAKSAAFLVFIRIVVAFVDSQTHAYILTFQSFHLKNVHIRLMIFILI